MTKRNALTDPQAVYEYLKTPENPASLSTSEFRNLTPELVIMIMSGCTISADAACKQANGWGLRGRGQRVRSEAFDFTNGYTSNGPRKAKPKAPKLPKLPKKKPAKSSKKKPPKLPKLPAKKGKGKKAPKLPKLPKKKPAKAAKGKGKKATKAKKKPAKSTKKKKTAPKLPQLPAPPPLPTLSA